MQDGARLITAPHGALTVFDSCATDADQAKAMVDGVLDSILVQELVDQGLG